MNRASNSIITVLVVLVATIVILAGIPKAAEAQVIYLFAVIFGCIAAALYAAKVVGEAHQAQCDAERNE